MRTYTLKKAPGLPLYESLYRALRDDILSGALPPGEKLPSKRALASHLQVSQITVEAAYSQLLSEGYLRAQERVGYFVESVERSAPVRPLPDPPEAAVPPPKLDLTSAAPPDFPFSVWSRLQREVTLDLGPALLAPMPSLGILELRQAIAGHLAAFRGLSVEPERILIGAGTDFLCNLLLQLLGRDKVFALEEPGYGKLRSIYTAGGARCVPAPLDSQGVVPQGLEGAQVLHFSPAHHFPTGAVTSMARRTALLEWAQAAPDRWIIEDDYDSEFRAHPLPAMASLDRERVIYMNTFSKSLAPAIRIGYLALPEALYRRLKETLGFYGCTVPSFEQYALARFLSRGYFEKHINRMRKTYRARRSRVIAAIQSCGPGFAIAEQDAGLHFLLKVDTPISDASLRAHFARAGVAIRTLSQYYHAPPPADIHATLVVNYAGVTEEYLPLLTEALKTVPGISHF